MKTLTVLVSLLFLAQTTQASKSDVDTFNQAARFFAYAKPPGIKEIPKDGLLLTGSCAEEMLSYGSNTQHWTETELLARIASHIEPTGAAYVDLTILYAPDVPNLRYGPPYGSIDFRDPPTFALQARLLGFKNGEVGEVANDAAVLRYTLLRKATLDGVDYWTSYNRDQYHLGSEPSAVSYCWFRFSEKGW